MCGVCDAHTRRTATCTVFPTSTALITSVPITSRSWCRGRSLLSDSEDDSDSTATLHRQGGRCHRVQVVQLHRQGGRCPTWYRSCRFLRCRSLRGQSRLQIAGKSLRSPDSTLFQACVSFSTALVRHVAQAEIVEDVEIGVRSSPDGHVAVPGWPRGRLRELVRATALTAHDHCWRPLEAPLALQRPACCATTGGDGRDLGSCTLAVHRQGRRGAETVLERLFPQTCVSHVRRGSRRGISSCCCPVCPTRSRMQWRGSQKSCGSIASPARMSSAFARFLWKLLIDVISTSFEEVFTLRKNSRTQCRLLIGWRLHSSATEDVDRVPFVQTETGTHRENCTEASGDCTIAVLGQGC